VEAVVYLAWLASANGPMTTKPDATAVETVESVPIVEARVTPG